MSCKPLTLMMGMRALLMMEQRVMSIFFALRSWSASVRRRAVTLPLSFTSYSTQRASTGAARQSDLSNSPIAAKYNDHYLATSRDLSPEAHTDFTQPMIQARLRL